MICINSTNTLISSFCVLTALQFGISAQLFGQSLLLATSSGSGSPGSQVSLNLTLASQGGIPPAALQWTLSYSSADFSDLQLLTGPAAAATGKSITCATQ